MARGRQFDYFLFSEFIDRMSIPCGGSGYQLRTSLTIKFYNP